jgi:phosphodiesterase/alkaline phosphatase D-like protein
MAVTRRNALLSLLGGAVTIAAPGRMGEALVTEAEAQAREVFRTDFSGRRAAADWSHGTSRFLTRFPERVGVREQAGQIQLPRTLATAGASQPVPTFLLDHDTALPTLTMRFSASGHAAKPGLVFGAMSIFAYHAVTIEEGALVLSRFERSRRVVLHRSHAIPLAAGHIYELQVAVTPGRIRARVGRGGVASLGRYQLDVRENVAHGMTGVLLVGEPGRPETTVRLRSLKLATLDQPRRTPMRPVYLLSGAPDQSGHTALRIGAERASRITFEWTHDPSFRSKQVRTVSAGAWPHTARTSISTEQETWWRAVIEDPHTGEHHQTAVQRIRPHRSSEKLVMAAASCAQLWDAPDYHGLHRFLAEAAPAPPAVLAYQGDFGYPSNSHASCLRAEPDFYQDRISRFLSDPNFTALRERMPVAFTMDDHEYGPQNNCNRTTLYPWTIELWNKMHADPSDHGYLEWRTGDVHCLTLDGRRYSDPPSRPESSAKTKLGATQKAWLKQTMLRSQAELFVVFSADIFASRNGDDCWLYGWSTEYQELMTFFHELQLDGKRVVIVSGDAHGMRVHNHPDPESRPGAPSVVEFICSGLRARTWSMERAGDQTLDPERRVSGKSGLGMIVIDPPGEPDRNVHLRAIAGDPGTPLDMFPPLTLPFRP